MLIKLEKAINRLMDWTGVLAAFLLILLVVIISFNVANRYYFQFNGLGVGFEELAWHFYAACFLLGIPFALRTGSHVRVDLIFENLSLKTRCIIDLVGSLIFLIPFCVIVIWSGWAFTMEAWGLGERPDEIGELIKQIVSKGVGEQSQDPGGLLNRWIIKGVIPFSFFLLLLSAISFVLHKINLLRGVANMDDRDGAHAHEAPLLNTGKGESS